MKTPLCPFSLDNLSDKELEALAREVDSALDTRAAARIAKRNAWINSRYVNFLARPNAAYTTVNDTTVVAIYCRSGVRIGKSRPVNGDEFDRRVGIAVAYAKAIGEKIPDFI